MILEGSRCLQFSSVICSDRTVALYGLCDSAATYWSGWTWHSTL